MHVYTSLSPSLSAISSFNKLRNIHVACLQKRERERKNS